MESSLLECANFLTEVQPKPSFKTLWIQTYAALRITKCLYIGARRRNATYDSMNTISFNDFVKANYFYTVSKMLVHFVYMGIFDILGPMIGHLLQLPCGVVYCKQYIIFPVHCYFVTYLTGQSILLQATRV